ncbi:hypothetical protein HGM15179_007935 [Zosterops borbonicus]|uniref:Large ribosomal subunit protein bL35m n=1 Tax=Zosterops borbonicus TaxID=364589 RepID=A0A8K1LMI7_9PASS|nr:hypothetical protein HGM15179_007935 [Zosterops borbonicus]
MAAVAVSVRGALAGRYRGGVGAGSGLGSGYKKKLWKKSAAQKKRLREFVLCTKTQCKLLDKMTTSFWKRRNWYIDDPYQKYHDRTNLRV